jgi:ubiquinone/menaquinone biosynthesis C-methylase UbiE
MELMAINNRYSELANSDCCLSCGGAVNYAMPQLGEVCVDLGSGRGTDALAMADQVGEKGFVYGIDISDGMLEKAREMAARFQINNASFIKSDLSEINLPEETADLVISNCTINHAPDKRAVWAEVYRILKKGGRFVVSDIYAVHPVAEEHRNNPEAVAECWAGAITKDEYLIILQSTGFTGIEIIEESKPYVKGKAEVASFTIAGKKSGGCSCRR